MDIKPLAPTPGLLWGFAFHGGAGTAVTNENCVEGFAAPHDWQWMHFALADHRARRFLDAFAPAPPAARTLLLGNETRFQIHLAEQHAYGILPDIEKDFDSPILGPGRLAFFLDGRHFITVRHKPMRVVDEVREQVGAGRAGLATPADAFVHVMEHFLETIEDRLARLTHDLDHVEDMVLSDRDDIDASGLGPVRRELSRWRRELSGFRSALLRTGNSRTPGAANCPIAPHLSALAGAAEYLDRDAGALADRGRLLYEEVDTRIAAVTNRSLSTLTVLSTLLLPPTFIAGAFGMNLNGIPWASGPEGFWWATGLCAVAVIGGYILLRRFRIL